MPRTLLVEGWTGLPHSYAIVNQYQCLAMMDRPDLRLLYRERPFPSLLTRGEGLFSADQRARMAGLPAPGPGDVPGAVLRLAAPFDFSPPPAGRLFVFGTLEWGALSAALMHGGASLAAALGRGATTVVTPSRWSAEGFLASGAPADRVRVVPHGVDTALFRPLPAGERAALRRRLGWDGFVFLTVGAVTPNKNLGELLRAFSWLAGRRPEARLVIKGLDAFYGSNAQLAGLVRDMPAAAAEGLKGRVRYRGEALDFAAMAELYQAADAYVAPYLAEGFNLPALEALACGLPLIVTAGGPTDDFTTPEVALAIASRIEAVSIALPGAPPVAGRQLRPDGEHLRVLMLEALDNAGWVRGAGLAGPALVAAGHTWSHVVDRLLGVLFPP